MCTKAMVTVAEQVLAADSQEELSQQLRLARIASRAIAEISCARCPQEVFRRLQSVCEQTWDAFDVQAAVGLTKAVAPEGLLQSRCLPKPVAAEELLCFDLAAAAPSAKAKDGIRCPWLGHQASLQVSDWGRWNLSKLPAAKQCFERLEELEDQFGSSGWNYPEHEGIARQYTSVLYLPLEAQSKCLGVLRLAARSHGRFAAAEREAVAQIARIAAERLEALRACYAMDRCCQETERKRARQCEKAATYRNLLNDMLPSHIVDGLCSVHEKAATYRNLLNDMLPSRIVDGLCSVDEKAATYRNLLNDMHPSHTVDGLCSVQQFELGEPMLEYFLPMQVPMGDSLLANVNDLEQEAGNERDKDSLARGMQIQSDLGCLTKGKAYKQSGTVLKTRTTKMGKLAYAERHECVAVLVSDVRAYTELSASVHAAEIMVMLHDLFSRFDAIVEKHMPAARKVETIGDGYVIAFGLSGHASEQAVAMEAVTVGAEMARAAQAVLTPLGDPVDIRVGVQVGQVVSRIVGKKGPRYCLFGDPMTTASLLESTGVPGQIHVTEHVRRSCMQGRQGLALAFRSADSLEVERETFLLDPRQVPGEGYQPQTDTAERNGSAGRGADPSCVHLDPSRKQRGPSGSFLLRKLGAVVHSLCTSPTGGPPQPVPGAGQGGDSGVVRLFSSASGALALEVRAVPQRC